MNKINKIFTRKIFSFYVGMPESGFMSDAIRKSGYALSLCHVHALFQIMYNNNLAEWKKNGRIKEYKLTKKGLKLQKLMKEIDLILQ